MVDVYEINREASIIELDGSRITKYVCYNCVGHDNNQKKILNDRPRDNRCPECGQLLSRVECMIPL